MKLLIAFACLAVVSAFPSSPGVGYRNDEGSQIRELGLNYNNLQNNDLLEAYQNLIENLSRLSGSDEKEEIVNNVIEAIVAIGQIITNNATDDVRPSEDQPEPRRGGNIHIKIDPENAPESPAKRPDADEISSNAPENNNEIQSSSEDISSVSNEIDEVPLDDEIEEDSFINQPIIDRRFRFPSFNENGRLQRIAKNILID